MPNPVVIAGASLAGLICVGHLSREGRDVILEASDDIGGRVRTNELGGFLLDSGFQVLLTAYPEAQRLLDYEDLNLKPFDSGSLSFTQQSVRWNDGRRIDFMHLRRTIGRRCGRPACLSGEKASRFREPHVRS